MKYSFFQKLSAFLMAILSAFLLYFHADYNIKICDGISGISFQDVKTIRDSGLTKRAYKKLIGNDATDANFVCKDETFCVNAGGTEIPVYTVPLYSGQKDKGTLHAFCFIESDATEPYEVRIKAPALISPALYPQKDFYQGLRYISFTVAANEEGTYTFFTNKNSDNHVLTVRIFNRREEAQQIAQYEAEYGAENVIVLDAGTHEAEQISLKSHSMLYLKSGAYLKIKHSSAVGGAIKAENFKNITIAGRGILDLSALDWHERNGMEFLYGENLTIHDITILNSANWSCYLYNVQHAEIKNVSIFGSRQNGDGIDICNSRDVTLTNCFVRAGDDCYNVKTLGNASDTPSEDILFLHNVAWATKARAAGITGETNCDIRNVTFDDMTILRSDATWNDQRIGALAIVNETGSGNIRNISFQNIEIIDSKSPPILLSVLSGREDVKMEEIRFENISFHSKKKISVYKNADSNVIDYSLTNVNGNGKPV